MKGLLWYDAKDDALQDKIGRAAARYREKHGRAPNVCFINPSNNEKDTGEFTVAVDGMTVQVATMPNVLLHHYWIGEQDDLAGSRQGRGNGNHKGDRQVDHSIGQEGTGSGGDAR